MSHEQIVIRDSIIFAVGLLFVSAGLADAARLLIRIPDHNAGIAQEGSLGLRSGGSAS